MIEQFKRLKTPLIVLSILTVVSFFLFTLNEIYSWKPWVSSITGNLGVAFLSTIITVCLINMYLSEKEEKEEKKIRNICLISLDKPINEIAYVIFQLVKATTETRGTNDTPCLIDFLKQVDITKIEKLDLFGRAPVYPERTWEVYLRTSFVEFTKKIQSFIEKYAYFLDADTIKLCEDIKNHQFIQCIKMIPHLKADHERENMHNPPNAYMQLYSLKTQNNPTMIDYLNALEKLVKIVASAKNNEQFIVHQTWNDNVLPELGSGIAK
ncbi:TPA: hypothetical protein ACXI9Z_002108 [Proteus mirabilis]